MRRFLLLFVLLPVLVLAACSDDEPDVVVIDEVVPTVPPAPDFTTVDLETLRAVNVGAIELLGAYQVGALQVAALDPQSTNIAIGRADGSVAVVETRTGETLRRDTAHNVRVAAVAFDATGRLLASVDEDGQVVIRDIVTDARQAQDSAIAQPDVLTFNADGSRLAVGGADGMLAVIAVAADAPLRSVSIGASTVSALSFTPLPDVLLAGTRDGLVQQITLLDAVTPTTDPDAPVPAADEADADTIDDAATPDGADIDADIDETDDVPETVSRFDTNNPIGRINAIRDGEPPVTQATAAPAFIAVPIVRHPAPVTALQLVDAPAIFDDILVISADFAGNVYYRNYEGVVAGGEPRPGQFDEINVASGAVRALALSQDKDVLLLGLRRGIVQAYDSQTQRILESDSIPPSSLAAEELATAGFADDGVLLTAVTRSGVIWIWGAEMGARPTITPTFTATFTPTATLTPSSTPTATNTPTPSDTPTITPTPSDTPTATNTPTDTLTPSNTPTDTLTPSNTPLAPTLPADVNAPTATPSDTPTRTPRPSRTPRPTNTASLAATATPQEADDTPATRAETATEAPTATATSTPTPDPDATETPFRFDRPDTLTPTITPTPSATLTFVCEVFTTGRNVNIRSGPSTDTEVAGTLTAGQRIQVAAQFEAADGFIWFLLTDDVGWVRSDVVGSDGDCEAPPFLTADAVEDLTAEAEAETETDDDAS